MSDNGEWSEKTLTPSQLSGMDDRHPQDERLRVELETWKRKYEEVFQEQCKTRSLETQLRERLHAMERHKLEQELKAANMQGRFELIEQMYEKLMQKMMNLN